jgi:Paraquat-inducible protein A
MVVPTWGLYANMIAQLISQISSHVMIHYHRRVVDHANWARRAIFDKTASQLHGDEEEVAEGFLDERERSSSSVGSQDEDSGDTIRKDRLCEHEFVRPHSRNAKLVARTYVNPLLVILAISMAALLIVGCALPSYSLEVMGIMGVLVESGKRWKQAVESHSVFSTAKMLVEQAAFLKGAGNYVGLGTLALLLVLTVLIVPLTQIFVLVLHWFVPMTKKTRRRMSIFLEGLQAWQYVEVYLIATIVAVWQLGPMSEFMINAYCGSLDSTFDLLVYYGILKESDAQCFRVEARLESAAYLLAAFALLLALLNTYVGNASKQYFRDADNKSFKETLVVPTTLLDSNHSTQRRDEDAITGVGTSTALESYVTRNPVIGSRGDNFSNEDIGGEEEFLLEADPLEPPAADKDPLTPPATDVDEAENTWRRIDALERIRPVPILFSDKFRWTLRSREVHAVAETRDLMEGKRDPANEDTHHSESLDSSVVMMKGDAPERILRSAPSSRTHYTLQDGFVEVDLDDDSDRLLDEAVEAKRLGGIEWTIENEDDDDDKEMMHTYAISVGTSQYESVAASLAPVALLYNTDSDTDDAFDDEGIPMLRAELADIDHRLSRDPKELERRLVCDDNDGRTEPNTVVLADDDVRTPQSSDTFEDELVSNHSDDDDRCQGTEGQEEEIVQGAAEPQLIRLERQTQGTPENTPRRPKGNSLLQDAFLL